MIHRYLIFLGLVEMAIYFSGVRKFAGISRYRQICISALTRNGERGDGDKSKQVKKPLPTIEDIKLKLSQVLKTPTGFGRDTQEKTDALYELLPSSQQELPKRTMQDGFDECLVPLSNVARLQSTYATVKGAVRVGRMLEDADLFAVWLCLKYIDNPKSRESSVSPFTIVTILVDDISFEKERPFVWNDLRYSGHVVWTGQTSMEVRILADFWDGNQWKLYTKAYFVMGARNAKTGKGAFVNQLTPKGNFEQEQWQRAMMRKKRRTAEENISLLKTPPHPDEQKYIFDNYMKTLDLSSFSINLTRRILPNDTNWISETTKCTELHPHPDYRNHQNTFFGGTLMRLANELGWLTAFLYAHDRPSLTYISKIEFRVPVPLDSYLKFVALVTYVEERFVNVTVVCESTDIYVGKTKTTNFFHFIYGTEKEMKPVMPASYLESLLHVQSIRFFRHYEKEYGKTG